MFKIDIARTVPKFILNDTNGYALAKAIETGVNLMNSIIQEGIDCLFDVSTMPEWRLDEMAWEYDLLYDRSADIDVKRQWIEEAEDTYSIYGTKAGVLKYLKAVYDAVSIQEWWEYSGDPFHFRVTVSEVWDEEKERKAHEAISRVAPVRSVLDSITFNGDESTAGLTIGAAVSGMEIVDYSQTIQ